MDLLIRISLYLFIFYSPVLLFLLFLVSRKYVGYSITSQWLSDLGDTRYASSSLFKLAWIIYGFTYLFFVFGLSKILPDMLCSSVVIILLSMFLLFGFLASLISNNTHKLLHYMFVAIDLLCITASNLFLMYIVSVSNLIPKYFILFYTTLIILSIVFSFSFAKLIIKARKTQLPLYETIKKDKSFLTRNITVLEWAYILLMIFNNFALGFVILQNLK